MANTYTQLYIQIVFAVQGRTNLIKEKNREALEKYMCGIINNHGSKPLAIYCNPNHCHVLVGLKPSTSVSEMARIIKSNSSKWINANSMTGTKFTWQLGFGAFSYSKDQLFSVTNYILNQAEHHKIKSFKEEYIELLKEFGVDHDLGFIFE